MSLALIYNERPFDFFPFNEIRTESGFISFDIGPECAKPALFTNKSIRPKRVNVSRTIISGVSSSLDKYMKYFNF
jgi:hypothetical protein